MNEKLELVHYSELSLKQRIELLGLAGYVQSKILAILIALS